MAIFEDPSIAAVGGFEPMISQTLKATSREGAHILLDSGDYPCTPKARASSKTMSWHICGSTLPLRACRRTKLATCW